MGSIKNMDIGATEIFLNRQAMQLAEFLDFEPLMDDPVETAKLLDEWFSGTSWRISGHKIVQLGKDASGSRFAAWIQSSAEQHAPVIYLGSEGAHGVLTSNPAAFVQLLAYRPVIGLRGGTIILHRETAVLSDSGKKALSAYSKSVRNSFGQLPPFEVCVSVADAIQQAFMKWVADVSLH